MEQYAEGQQADESSTPVRELSRVQRRVLGVLVEKAFTVPESYPLTLKSATSGSNQKNNRSPVTNYSEDQVLQALEELRELGLVAVVHTESGRTERYRHYTRKRFPFSEPQLAIMTELLLRGRQQLGELRARASRMVPIESLADLRSELNDLIAAGYVQTNGSLDRRGAEVDHALYLTSENMRLEPGEEPAVEAPAAPVSAAASDMSRSSPSATSENTPVAALRAVEQELRQELEALRQEIEEVRDSLQELRRTLGA